MHLQDINNDYDTPCNYFCWTVTKRDRFVVSASLLFDSVFSLFEMHLIWCEVDR